MHACPAGEYFRPFSRTFGCCLSYIPELTSFCLCITIRISAQNVPLRSSKTYSPRSGTLSSLSLLAFHFGSCLRNPADLATIFLSFLPLIASRAQVKNRHRDSSVGMVTMSDPWQGTLALPPSLSSDLQLYRLADRSQNVHLALSAVSFEHTQP